MQWLETKIPPPLVAVLFALLMWGLAQVTQGVWEPVPARIWAAAVVGALALVFSFGGFFAFGAAKTTINPTRPEEASQLVTDGIYKITRNPMYVGLTLLLIAWAIWLANPLTGFLVLAFAIYIDRFQIAPEERALAAKFGEAFADYRKKVRRWV